MKFLSIAQIIYPITDSREKLYQCRAADRTRHSAPHGGENFPHGLLPFEKDGRPSSNFVISDPENECAINFGGVYKTAAPCEIELQAQEFPADRLRAARCEVVHVEI